MRCDMSSTHTPHISCHYIKWLIEEVCRDGATPEEATPDEATLEADMWSVCVLRVCVVCVYSVCV